MATDITTQFVREAPEIEAQKLGLLQSSKALVDAANKAAMEGRYLTPSYQIAGFSPDQVQAMEAARTGIGAYQPYMATATQQSMDAARGFNRAMQTLQGADTRGQFGRARNLFESSIGAMNTAGPQFSEAAGFISAGLGQGRSAAEQAAQAAAQQSAFKQGVDALYGSAEQAKRAAQLGAAPTAAYRPDLTTFQMSPSERVSAQQVGTPLMAAAQTSFRPDLQAFQMGPAERVQTQSFAQPGSAEAYMSPYMQNVVDIQQREAQRQADIAATRRGQAFARAGAFGGSRQAIENAEAARNLAMQKGDIQATGLQSAFQQAQQQFNQEQQARLAAQQANQQAGLNVGGQNLASQLGVQQLGTQMGLQTALANLNSSQQANVQNQAAQLQAQGMNAQQALQAALANQQASLTVGQQNIAAQLGVQQLGAQQGLQSALANQALQGQYGLSGAQYGLQAADALRQAGLGQMSGAGQLGQLGLAAAQQQAQAGQMSLQGAQQTASQEAQRSQAAQEAARYMGNVGQGIGALAGQEFGIGAQMAQGIGGLASQQAGLAGQIAGMGAQQQAMGQQDVNFLYNIGAQQQRQRQAVLDAQRQNQLQQNMQPFQQIGFLSDVYKGAPSTQMAMTQQNQAAPSPFQQIAGLGIGATAAAAAANKAGLL